MRAIHLGILSALLSLGMQSQASEGQTLLDTDREISQTFVNFYLQEKKYNSAKEVLVQHLREDAEDSQAWNLVGLLWLQKKNFERSMRAFEVAIKYSTGKTKAVYFYNLADCQVQSGDIQSAKAALEQVKEIDKNLQSSVNIALAELEKGKPLPALRWASTEVERRWSLSGTLQSGYDSNVLLLSEDTLASVERSNTASPFVTAGMGLNFRRSSESSIQNFGLNSSFTYETNTVAQSFNTLINQGTWSFVKTLKPGSSTTWGWDVNAGLSYLNNDGFAFFSWSNQLNPKWIWTHHARAESQILLPVSYQKFKVDAGDDPADDRSGLGFGATLQHRHLLGRFTLSLSAKYFQQLAEGRNFQTTTYEIPLSLGWQMSDRSSAMINASLGRILYPDSDTDRQDSLISFGLTLYRKLSKSWMGAVQGQLIQNHSNLDDAEYQKISVSLLGAYAFF